MLGSSTGLRCAGFSATRKRGVLALWACVLWACQSPPASPAFEAGREVVVPVTVATDSGVVIPTPTPDAGPTFRSDQAGEPCPDDAFVAVPEPEDGGAEPSRRNTFGICVALRKYSGVMRLNDRPVAGPVSLTFKGGAWGSQYDRTPDRNGFLEVRVLRGRYDVFEYRPSGVFPTHEGPATMGLLDLTKDQSRDLGVRSHPIRGTARFGNLPFTAQSLPPDVQITSYGDPPSQRVSATSLGGAYEVALLEGTQGLYVSTPPAALGGTELIEYPVAPSLSLSRPSNVDIDIPARQLSGTLLLDGQPMPDRVPGADFEFEFTPAGSTDVAARSYHLGGVAEYSALVPEAKYGVSLRVEGAPSRTYPSRIYNIGLDSDVDLRAGNLTRAFNLQTVRIEGALTVDGVAVAPNPGAVWSMYMFSYATPNKPGSLLYFDVPLEAPTFNLRTFPDLYFTAILVDSAIAPSLALGWYRVDRYFDAKQDTVLPINIETSWFEGKLLIDGKPPPQGQVAGEMWFRGRESSFIAPVVTAEDGTFRVRVAKGAYELRFKIDPLTYPDYASGYLTVLSRVDLASDQVIDLAYDTRVLSGPLRVDGAPVPDTVIGEELGLDFVSSQDEDFTWGFEGGTPNYRVRIPKGEYTAKVTLRDGVWPDVAHGDAPLGVKIPVLPAPATGSGTNR